MAVQLSDPIVMVNNEVVAVIPNSVKFTEGLGEQKIRAASAGGGQVVQIYSHDVESNFSKVMFSIPSTVENIELARQWKQNRNQNLIQIQGRTPEGDISRTFQQAALLSDYEVGLGSDTDVPLEFTSDAAI